LLLLLLELLRLFFLGHVMAYGAACRGSQYGMVTGDVSGHGTDCSALETALGQGSLGAGE